MRLFRKKKHVVKEPMECMFCGTLDTNHKETTLYCNNCGRSHIRFAKDYKITFDRNKKVVRDPIHHDLEGNMVYHNFDKRG